MSYKDLCNPYKDIPRPSLSKSASYKDLLNCQRVCLVTASPHSLTTVQFDLPSAVPPTNLMTESSLF